MALSGSKCPSTAWIALSIAFSIFFLSYFFGQHEKSSVFKRVFHLFNRVINKVGEKRKKLFRVIFNEFFRLSARKIIFFLKTEYSIIPKNFFVLGRYENFRTLYIVVETFRTNRCFSKCQVTNSERIATTQYQYPLSRTESESSFKIQSFTSMRRNSVAVSRT